MLFSFNGVFQTAGEAWHILPLRHDIIPGMRQSNISLRPAPAEAIAPVEVVIKAPSPPEPADLPACTALERSQRRCNARYISARTNTPLRPGRPSAPLYGRCMRSVHLSEIEERDQQDGAGNQEEEAPEDRGPHKAIDRDQDHDGRDYGALFFVFIVVILHSHNSIKLPGQFSLQISYYNI